MAPYIPQQANTLVAPTVPQMNQGIVRLEKVINEIDKFDLNNIFKRFGPEVEALKLLIEGTLASVFGHNTVEYSRYKDAANLDKGPYSVPMGPKFGGMGRSYMSHSSVDEARQYVSEGKKRSIHILRQAVCWLHDEITTIEHISNELTVNTTMDGAIMDKPIFKKIFIVHGHDTAARESVARFIEKIGFEAIILHEQANQGRTVIEKVEAHGDVGFAIVLLTPDDTGCKAGDVPKPRPRQNVLLELGYFIGCLGRPKVCALATSDSMELPTDFAGVVWEPFDDAGGWKRVLGRELEAAGFDIDWNKVMKL